MVNTHLITFLVSFVNTSQTFIVNPHQIKEALQKASDEKTGGYCQISEIKEFDRSKNRFIKTKVDRVVGTVYHSTETLKLLSKFGYIPKKHHSYTI